MDRHVWLIGMMGSGKSVVARAAAKKWDVGWFDTDLEVARRTGCSIAQLWGEKGEEAFRNMEAAAIERVAGHAASVIATGGGSVLRRSNVSVMRASGLVVWLSAPPEVLSERVGDGAGRPLLNDSADPVRLEELLTERRAAYANAATLVVDVEHAGIAEVVDEIEAAWKTY